MAGLTHYPPLSMPDGSMADILRRTLSDPDIPAVAKNPHSWPPTMQAEWGTDQAKSSASTHRDALVSGLRTIRDDLEAFDPDLVVIWGDDQHENFHEDIIPAYAVLAYDDMVVQPWAHPADSAMTAGKPNVWGEQPSTERLVRGHRTAARWLLEQLIPAGFDVAYAYRPLHHLGLSHAFLNTILYLDYDRQGFEWPVVAMPINCYGRKVVGARGFMTRITDHAEPDPPSPSPARLMALGAALAAAALRSEWRVALLASSSWSHAFLCDHTWRLRPDTQADHRLYEALKADNWEVWEALTVDDIEHAGQQELLNWCVLLGAVRATHSRLKWSTFIETACFNSNKVFALWEPVHGDPPC